MRLSTSSSPASTGLPRYLRLGAVISCFGVNRALIENLATRGVVRSIKANAARQTSRFYCRQDLEEALDAIAAGRSPTAKIRRRSSIHVAAARGANE